MSVARNDDMDSSKFAKGAANRMNSGVVVALFSFLGVVVAAGIGVFGGYYFGRAQSRNERRDEAIAGIFKEMMLFYRGVVSWTSDPSNSNGPITEPETDWKTHCRKRYASFLDTYYENGIWLGKDTYELIQEFAHAGKDVLNEFQGMNTAGYLPSGKKAWDFRAEILMPKLDEVQEALRTEIEKSRYIIPYRIVITKNE